MSVNSNYYNWNNTLGYNADVTCVITMRGVGKTYGLRKQFIMDWKKDGSRFVEVTRFKDEIDDIFSNYFEKLQKNKEKCVEGLLFRYDKKHVYVAEKPEEGKKPNWEIIGYFAALSQMQRTKKKTYVNVKRIVFDEAILDYTDRYHKYMPNEYALLANVVDSCTRENADNSDAKYTPKLYLLANACDLVNPIFARYGIDEAPKFGKQWYDGKTFLLDYVDPGKSAKNKLDNTLAGRMIRGTKEADAIAKNIFKNANNDFIAQKTPEATFNFGVVYRGHKFGVWLDYDEGYYYVTSKIPKNTKEPIYALTRDDNKANLIAAKRSEYVLKTFVELYYIGVIKYESIALRNNFLDALSLFGVR